MLLCRPMSSMMSFLWLRSPISSRCLTYDMDDAFHADLLMLR